MPRCEICDKEFKDARGLAAHNRFKHQTTADAEPFEATVVGEPAIIPEWERSSINSSTCGRSVKMFRPICATCQRGKETPWDWWKRCTHNPYISMAEIHTRVPRYDDKDADGNPLPAGRKRLVGTDDLVEWVERPNRVPVALGPRVYGQLRLDRKRRIWGFIFPHELRTPTYPNGIADPCEYRNCYKQEGVKQYRWGRFCRELEARLVGHDARMDGGGGALEVGDSDKSREKQARQLEAVPL